MSDPVVEAQVRVAIFALNHAKVDAEGEAKSCLGLALAACGDALDALKLARTGRHLEVIADALAAPGSDAA